jgi:hypothetical protein
VLGDLNGTQLKTIETTVHTVSASSQQPATFAFDSKASLLPEINLADISPSEDVMGQVDFEIGVGALVFVGYLARLSLYSSPSNEATEDSSKW